MLKRRCPFVGLCGDPDTVVAFASTRNCCNRVENPGPVRLAYQHSYCFTFDHRRCEVLLQENRPSELPPEISAFPPRKRAIIIVGSAASIVVTAIFLVIFFGWWQPAGAVDQDKVVHSTPLEPTQSVGSEIGFFVCLLI